MPKPAQSPVMSGRHNRDTTAAIRAELARVRLTQAELARQLSYTRPRLQRRMNCDVAFTVDELHAIANVIGCPAERFTHPVATEVERVQ